MNHIWKIKGLLLLKRRKIWWNRKGSFFKNHRNCSLRTSAKRRLFRTFNSYSFNFKGRLCNRRTGYCPCRAPCPGGEQILCPTIANLCPIMINFNALDFNVCRSEEVISSFWHSVYFIWRLHTYHLFTISYYFAFKVQCILSGVCCVLSLHFSCTWLCFYFLFEQFSPIFFPCNLYIHLLYIYMYTHCCLYIQFICLMYFCPVFLNVEWHICKTLYRSWKGIGLHIRPMTGYNHKLYESIIAIMQRIIDKLTICF